MSAVQSIRDFIASINYREMVSIGYEIETQFETNREFDEDGCRESYEVSDDEIVAHAGLSWNQRWVDRINDSGVSLADALGVDIDDIIDSYVDSQREDEDSPFWSSDNLEDLPIDGFEMSEDGSVSGWEYCTEDRLENGGVSYTDALELAEVFYDQLDENLYTDHRCSCHVHLKVQGVRYHQGSYKLYCLIIDELSKVWSSPNCPKSILERIKKCHHHYEPKCDHMTKFNTVHVHGQGTWEFRLWGNTKSPSEVKFCIDNSIDTFRSAYNRYYARDNSLFDRIVKLYPNEKLEYTFPSIARDAMVQGKSIETILADIENSRLASTTRESVG